jgi:flagellar hook-length control protein FliK
MFPPPAPGADDGAIRFELDEPTLDAETVGVQGGGKGGAGLEADLGLRAKNAGKKNAAGTAGAGDAGQAAREEAFRQGGGRSGASAGTPVGAADAAASADTSEAGGGEAATADAPAEVAAASAAGARQRTAAGSARAETANVSAAAEAALAQQHAGKLAEGQISARGGRHTSQGNLAGGERGSQSAAARAKTRAASGEQTAPDGGGTGVSGVRQIDLTVNTLANANAVSGDGAANGNGTAAITEIAHHAGTTGGAGAENGAGERLSNMLAHELRTSLNSDIVRHASVLMRDGGDGLIRLSLKPESLGNVKIRLQMAENKISGEIIVETKEALKAFEQQIHELEKAFQAQGYDAAHLQMSLANDSGQGQLAGGDAPEFSSGKAAERYERSGEITRADALAAYFFPERELDVFA